MLRLIYLGFAALFLLQPAFAQQLSKEFEVISKNELDYKAYEKDPDAEAVVLFDIGKSVFIDTDKGYDIRFTRTKRVKVLSRAGIDQAEISIPYYVDGYGKTEKIASIEAYSYNEVNGVLNKKAVDLSKVYEEKVNERWRVKKFAFPDVKEGSIIEYQYILETPFHFNLPDWYFQDKIPTIYSEYTAQMIPFYEYVFIAQGMSKFTSQQSVKGKTSRTYPGGGGPYGQNVFNDMIYTFVMKDVPAFKDEAFITSREDHVMKIDFQLAKFHSPRGGSNEIISTWPELSKELLKNQNFGKYINAAERQSKKLLEDEIKLVQGTDFEKSRQLVEWVKANFNWNEYYGKYTSKSAKDFLEQKEGSVAEINLFLAGLLNAAGIKAQPVILSTRNHGKINQSYPFDHFFNYVIVLIEADGKSYLADGTEEMIAYNKIPPRCINEQGLVVKDKEVLWVDLYSNIESLDHKNILLKLDAKSLTANTVVSIQSTEYDALAYRNHFKDDSTKISKYLLDNGFNKVSAVRTYNFDKTNLPYSIAYQGEIALEAIDDKIVVSPFLNFPIKENKLTQKKRSYPVDFIYSKKEAYRSVIEIPEGYKVVSVPETFELDNELAQIKLLFVVKDNVVEAMANYHFKKGLYVAAEYDRIKYYYEQIVKRFNEQVVLEASK